MLRSGSRRRMKRRSKRESRRAKRAYTDRGSVRWERRDTERRRTPVAVNKHTVPSQCSFHNMSAFQHQNPPFPPHTIYSTTNPVSPHLDNGRFLTRQPQRQASRRPRTRRQTPQRIHQHARANPQHRLLTGISRYSVACPYDHAPCANESHAADRACTAHSQNPAREEKRAVGAGECSNKVMVCK